MSGIIFLLFFKSLNIGLLECSDESEVISKLLESLGVEPCYLLICGRDRWDKVGWAWDEEFYLNLFTHFMLLHVYCTCSFIESNFFKFNLNISQ